MAESLGGSRRGNDYAGATRPISATRGQGRTAGGGGGGGILDRAATARGGGGGGGARTGGMAALLGGPSRPRSAPRERPPGDKTTAARARVEELRQIKEAQFWGREDKDAVRAAKRDLPAFWSVSTHGQPFNDERLASGAANFYRLAGPAGAGPPVGDAVGPATAQQAALRMSLEKGRKLFSSLADLAPLQPGTWRSLDDLERLTDADREYILGRITPYQRIHALSQCWDKDPDSEDFMPWPLVVLNRDHLADTLEGRANPRPAKYDMSDWRGGPAQRDLLMRLAVSELEYIMRRHLKFMSDRECSAARAPAALEKDILRAAFWRVDPQKTGSVSIQQFLQVWQNLLRLLEYEDEWVKGKDLNGKPKHTQLLKPMRTVLLDRNMAAAMFVKYGFDKDGLLPYVVFINALCETPARLLGHEVVLNKKDRAKNGLEDELDVSLCLGNAKIVYRYCKTGVFPPGEFTSRMGRRSFKPPKAHMWLEHVYGYAGMLEYTRQSNLFYTHSTGAKLSDELRPTVEARLRALHGPNAPPAALREEEAKRVEFVYYTGSVGVVMSKERFDAGLPCQRFFFGHNNDIQCLAIHPNRKWVATGQQKATGEDEVPYVCVWDVDHCMQLQRLDHDRNERGVVAVAFSGDLASGKGGELVITVTADDKHTIHVWRWMPAADKYANAHYIPGWSFGPEKKLAELRTSGMFFSNPAVEGQDDAWLGGFPFDLENWKAACGTQERKRSALPQLSKQSSKQKGDDEPDVLHPNEYAAVQRILKAARKPIHASRPEWEAPPWWAQPPPKPGSEAGPCGLWSHFEHPLMRIRADDVEGFYTCMRAVKREEGPWQEGGDAEKMRLPHHEQTHLGCNGTPPMVYGIVWNPLKPSDGRRGSEFASYGVKHLKVWIADDAGSFVGNNGSFGSAHIENVLSVLYVPAMHAMRSPGDSCILTGFASGSLGLWVPPYPTRPGTVYTLVRHFKAHDPGKPIPLNDGTQVRGGVRALQMRASADGGLEVLSGGADGRVLRWRLGELGGVRKDGTPNKGVDLTRVEGAGGEFLLMAPVAANKREESPIVVALDAHPALPAEFLAGTNGCDIWEVDADPRVIVEGHEEDLDEVAPHPEFPHVFATACKSGKCRLWDARLRDVTMSADLAYELTGIAFSNEHLTIKDDADAVLYAGYHLAVSGANGQLTVMRTDNLQPLVHRQDVYMQQAIPEMKYSPVGGPRMLAAAAADLTVYLYRADRNYQLAAKCMGHSGTVTHVDWSLPIVLPGTPHDGKFVLQSCDTAGNLLYWDPDTGKKLPYNMRDTEWYTWSLTVGFDVMGIWPDTAKRTDINSVDRARLGVPVFDPYEAKYERSAEAAFKLPDEPDCADGVSGAGYLLTADDFSTIKLFNYPVVADDAPYKVFRGHASHVTCVRFLADDRVAVSIGGHDRGIYQWRTCGIASGLPPVPVIYQQLKEREEQAMKDPEVADALRAANDPALSGARRAEREQRLARFEALLAARAKPRLGELWAGLHAHARAFRAYERLKLYAARVAVEEKRVNSAAGATPQPKLPAQMVWAKLPGTNQFGPRLRSDVEREERQAKAGGASSGGNTPAKAGGGGGGGSVKGSPAAGPRPGGSSTPPAAAPPSRGGSQRQPASGGGGGAGGLGASQSELFDSGDADTEVASYEPSNYRKPPAERTPSVRSSKAGGGGGGGGGSRTPSAVPSTSGRGLGGGAGGPSGRRYGTESLDGTVQSELFGDTGDIE